MTHSVDEMLSKFSKYGTHSALNMFTEYSMYSPKSVVEAMLRHKFGTYWNRAETYEALKVYIQMDMDGLKDAVVRMLAGEKIRINTGTFENDMTTFAAKVKTRTLFRRTGADRRGRKFTITCAFARHRPENEKNQGGAVTAYIQT